jgi:hypothetical protein
MCAAAAEDPEKITEVDAEAEVPVAADDEDTDDGKPDELPAGRSENAGAVDGKKDAPPTEGSAVVGDATEEHEAEDDNEHLVITASKHGKVADPDGTVPSNTTDTTPSKGTGSSSNGRALGKGPRNAVRSSVRDRK